MTPVEELRERAVCILNSTPTLTPWERVYAASLDVAATIIERAAAVDRDPSPALDDMALTGRGAVRAAAFKAMELLRHE